MNPPTLSVSDQTFVMVFEQLVEVSCKILIYLIQVLDIPKVPEDVDEEFIERMMFTMEELEVLESVIEENFESL
jgi:hypothetical protein